MSSSSSSNGKKTKKKRKQKTTHRKTESAFKLFLEPSTSCKLELFFMLVLPFSTSSIFVCVCVCLFLVVGKVTLFLSHERTVDTSVKKGDSHEFEAQTKDYEQRRSVFFARIKMNISFALLKMFDVLFSGACITLRFIRISPFLSFSSLISSVSIRTVQNSPSFSRTLPPASRSRRLSSPSPRFRKTPPPARSSLETSRTSS